ncbi:hypothetical protein FNH05_13410 [Amycolatopsis rhizosphaerae]|uniref:Uncharacterized protein n=1 Tax=Amycolatopsis rhizosphaerae TaxID=2053003 RepID=A0A558CTV8_9PSEU|nr:hypothetical protein [Amycolatopsis rhizosphaerae]TVT52132.1 hypothetical protein FNH05_13410 [Amycolatopsis rhizosphaerae]
MTQRIKSESLKDERESQCLKWTLAKLDAENATQPFGLLLVQLRCPAQGFGDQSFRAVCVLQFGVIGMWVVTLGGGQSTARRMRLTQNAIRHVRRHALFSGKLDFRVRFDVPS